tara:strand:- start:9743 stop:10288 length:546 start_codon:yes stop_codon:yes gene_type:complete
MKNAFVAAAACFSMLIAVPQASFAGEEKVKTKTVALQSKVSKSGYASAKSPLSAAMESANPYSKIITKFAKAYGVPVDLAHAVVKVESNFNPKARGQAGEVGLMQIKPATARMMGYKGSVKSLYNPETNIEFGMKYLAAAHELGGGETCGTILKYNAGHGAKRMNPISKRYCGKVLALLQS